MRTLIRIGESKDSMKIIIPAVREIAPNKLITTDAILSAGDKANDYYVDRTGKYDTFRSLVAKKGYEIYVECEPEKADLIRISEGRTKGEYTVGGTYIVQYLGVANTFLIDEKVRLWDNTITGYHATKHMFEGTVIEVKRDYESYKHVTFEEYRTLFEANQKTPE